MVTAGRAHLGFASALPTAAVVAAHRGWAPPPDACRGSRGKLRSGASQLSRGHRGGKPPGGRSRRALPAGEGSRGGTGARHGSLRGGPPWSIAAQPRSSAAEDGVRSTTTQCPSRSSHLRRGSRRRRRRDSRSSCGVRLRRPTGSAVSCGGEDRRDLRRAAQKWKRDWGFFVWGSGVCGGIYLCGARIATPNAYILNKILKARSAYIKGQREYPFPIGSCVRLQMSTPFSSWAWQGYLISFQ
jgi:hypothetical protein